MYITTKGENELDFVLNKPDLWLKPSLLTCTRFLIRPNLTFLENMTYPFNLFKNLNSWDILLNKITCYDLKDFK